MLCVAEVMGRSSADQDALLFRVSRDVERPPASQNRDACWALPGSEGRAVMDWDYAIIGSGFGGSVSGLRLAEKGYRVVMLEKGRRFGAEDFRSEERRVG